MDKEESKSIIVNEYYTKNEESECVHKNINKKRDTKNMGKYEKYSVTDEVPSYFNIFECVGNILNRLDVTYERVCMATKEDEYLAYLLETIIKHNNRHKVPLSK